MSDLPSPADLQPRQFHAAFLDSQGANRETIAKACNTTTKTVSEWRRLPAYKQAMDAFQAQDLARLQGLVQALKSELVHAARSAVETGVAALEAVKGDGSPDWHTRLRAMESLLSFAHMKVGIGPDEAHSGEGGGAAAAAAILIVNPDGGTVITARPDEVHEEV